MYLYVFCVFVAFSELSFQPLNKCMVQCTVYQRLLSMSIYIFLYLRESCWFLPGTTLSLSHASSSQASESWKKNHTLEITVHNPNVLSAFHFWKKLKLFSHLCLLMVRFPCPLHISLFIYLFISDWVYWRLPASTSYPVSINIVSYLRQLCILSASTSYLACINVLSCLHERRVLSASVSCCICINFVFCLHQLCILSASTLSFICINCLLSATTLCLVCIHFLSCLQQYRILSESTWYRVGINSHLACNNNFAS